MFSHWIMATLQREASVGGRVVLGYYFSRRAGPRRIGRLPSSVFEGHAFDGWLLPQWDGFGANQERLSDAARSSGFYNAQLDDDGVGHKVGECAISTGC